MNKKEAERVVLLRLNGVAEIILIPYHGTPYDVLVAANGNKCELYKVSNADVLYYKETNDKEEPKWLF